MVQWRGSQLCNPEVVGLNHDNFPYWAALNRCEYAIDTK